MTLLYISYFYLGQINCGSFTFQTYGLFIVLGVLVGHWDYLRRCKKLGVDLKSANAMVLYAVPSIFFTSHFFVILLNTPELIWMNPMELIKITNSWSTYGGVLGGFLAWSIWKWRYPEQPHHQLLEQGALSFGIAFFFARIGCSLVHDHVGVETTFFMAINFGAHYPYGIRHDLGFYECMWVALCIGFFLVFTHLKHQLVNNRTGLLLSLMFLLYCPPRFFMDFLRLPPEQGGDTLYYGFTSAQYFSVIGTWIGFYLLKKVLQKVI